MSGRKMVLVIDEPEKCDECPLLWAPACGCFDSEERHECCPLKYLPEKLLTEGKEPLKRAAGYAYGWNDCRDEIGGKDAESNVERDLDCLIEDA